MLTIRSCMRCGITIYSQFNSRINYITIFTDAIFNISCCYFQHSLSTRKEFKSIQIRYLWNVIHETLSLLLLLLQHLQQKASKQNKVNQLCLQLSTRKIVLLLTLLLRLFLCCQQSYALQYMNNTDPPMNEYCGPL